MPGATAEANGEPIIEATDIHKRFGALHVLKGVSLSVAPGEVIVILGPSGSGKSTFLRTLNHLEKIDAGRITVCGRLIGYAEREGRLAALRQSEVAKRRRDIGMVFQQFNLFPQMTALENIMAAPRHVLKVNEDEAREDATRLLELVGLGEKADVYPEQLSGGQQQRVAIARALAMHPQVMLFDEPTSALDPEMITEVLDVMTNLTRRGMTMIVVTHEVGFARACADRIVFMDDGQMIEEAPTEQFFDHPRQERTRQFLSKILH